MIVYRELCENEICRGLFRHFIRHQTVTECWRTENGKRVIRYAPFIDDWTEDDYLHLIEELHGTVYSGGFVYGAFCKSQLKGFASVDGELSGSRRQYLDLTNIYVSEEMRNHGIGKHLFTQAKLWAKAHGAEKLYISAHSALESQGFYHSMGCIEAEEYFMEHVEAEPYDSQLECRL